MDSCFDTKWQRFCSTESLKKIPLALNIDKNILLYIIKETVFTARENIQKHFKCKCPFSLSSVTGKAPIQKSKGAKQSEQSPPAPSNTRR